MLKKVLLTALFALQFFAATQSRAADPLPECNPCPYVR